MRKWNSAGRSLSLGAGFGLLPSMTDLLLTYFYFSYYTVMCMGGRQVPDCGVLKRTEDACGTGVTSGRELLDEGARTELQSVL